MIELNLKKVEQQLNLKLLRNTSVLGLDLATRTGYCILETTNTKITLDYNFIDLKTKDINARFTYMIGFFYDLIKPNYKIIIEDTYLKWNPDAFKFLSRLGGVIYAICYFKKIEQYPIFIYATSARKRLGIKGNTKKPEVHEFLMKELGLQVEDEDIVDAIVLAFNGIITGEVYCSLITKDKK